MRTHACYAWMACRLKEKETKMILITFKNRIRKTLFAVAFFLCLSGIAVRAQGHTVTPAKVKISVTDKSNISSSEIGQSFDSHCPEVGIALDAAKADYLLEAVDRGTGRGAGRGR